ncbi:MAG: response regulator transcription factor [Chloroflexi bacterium]|nr:response regulator transcription factor [Chloroflexota bacterium]
MAESVTVLLVDDHPLVRDGLRAMLASDTSIAVLGDAGSAVEAIQQVRRLRPQVVLMDIRMPGASGIEATRAIKRDHPSTAVIVLTMYDSEAYIVEAVQAGAAGYLVKDTSRELLCHAVHAALDGGVMIRSDLLRIAMQDLVQSQTQATEMRSLVEGLTQRELDVLSLLAQGCANRKIGQHLHLAEVTVKKHVQAIIAKLHASDRTQAAVTALRAGLIS